MPEDVSSIKNKDFNQDSITPEYTGWGDILKQLAFIEWSVDLSYKNALLEIKQGNNTFYCFCEFYINLCVFFDRLRPYMFSDYLKELDQEELEIKKEYDVWDANHLKYVPSSLIDKMRFFKRKLQLIKQQKLKIGIPVRIEKTKSEKLKRAIQ